MSYHPDPAINAEVALDALDAERADLAAGYPPRPWQCGECGASHARGHFGSIGVHRCLRCGYAAAFALMQPVRALVLDDAAVEAGAQALRLVKFRTWLDTSEAVREQTRVQARAVLGMEESDGDV